jgi:hypothetical protein
MLLGSKFNDVSAAFQRVTNTRASTCRNDTSFTHFARLLNNWLSNAQSTNDFLDSQITLIAANIVNTKSIANNGYECTIAFNDTEFSITQFSSNSTNITIRDPNTLEEVTVDITFPELKKGMLELYIREHRISHGKAPIDLALFDLTDTNIDLSDIDFARTVLSAKNVDAIIAGGGSLEGAIDADANDAPIKEIANEIALSRATPRSFVKADVDKPAMTNPLVTEHANSGDVQKNFEHDFLLMLNMYSQTVAEIIRKSTSLDLVEKASREKSIAHNNAYAYVWDMDSLAMRVRATIKTSTGNCSDMAITCKGLFDLYLVESLKLLGYDPVSIRSYYAGTHQQFSNHAVVFLTCSFNGISKQYIIDPWSLAGKAWLSRDAIQFFRNSAPDEYLDPATISFSRNESSNAMLEEKEYQDALSTIFVHFKVKEQLDAAIKVYESKFIGLPAA